MNEFQQEQIPKLILQFRDGSLGRRAFLRKVVALGIGSAATYSLLKQTESKAQEFGTPTTRARGEEGHPIVQDHQSYGLNTSQGSTLTVGEEDVHQPPHTTTYAVGEEGPQPYVQPTTERVGEEDIQRFPQITTRALGEEGNLSPSQMSALAGGEEGKLIPILPQPRPPQQRPPQTPPRRRWNGWKRW